MLKKLVKKLGKKKSGFTLIELIVVIAILGILAAILIPAVGGFIGSARTKAANADARTVFTAAQAYIINDTDALTDGANVYATGGTVHVSLKINDFDLAAYLGTSTKSFTINTITVSVSGGNSSVKSVTITETANSTPGSYGISASS
jgi:type IV pilus assembly protein PilA